MTGFESGGMILESTTLKLPENKYMFKAMWVGTKHEFWISAYNRAQALKRAQLYIKRMEGGPTCLDLDLMREILVERE